MELAWNSRASAARRRPRCATLARPRVGRRQHHRRQLPRTPRTRSWSRSATCSRSASRCGRSSRCASRSRSATSPTTRRATRSTSRFPDARSTRPCRGDSEGDSAIDRRGARTYEPGDPRRVREEGAKPSLPRSCEGGRTRSRPLPRRAGRDRGRMIPEPENLPGLEPAGNTFRGEGAGLRAGAGRDAPGACAHPSPRTAGRRSRDRLDTSWPCCCSASLARPAAGGSAADECLAAWRIGGVPGSLGNVSVSCRDGDPSCDGDGTADGVCRVRAAFCLNAPGLSARRARARRVPRCGERCRSRRRRPRCPIRSRAPDVCTTPADLPVTLGRAARRRAAVQAAGPRRRQRTQRRRSAAGDLHCAHGWRTGRSSSSTDFETGMLATVAVRPPRRVAHPDAADPLRRRDPRLGRHGVRREPVPRRQRPAPRPGAGARARASSARPATARTRTTSSWSRRTRRT